MREIEELVRPQIRNLDPYKSARDDFQGMANVYLDANENPYGVYNRYPDPYQQSVKEKLSFIKGVNTSQIFLGNGSDEIIDLLLRVFCEPNTDRAITFTPTYGMYQVSADINCVELIKIPLNSDFQINPDAIERYRNRNDIKLMFICSPNNPTGNSLQNLEPIIKSFEGIVIVDEAYIDFANSESWVAKIKEYPNLVVIQTFSKAWGLAGVRVGAAYANKKIIQLLSKVKPPYNISSLNQIAVSNALENIEEFENRKLHILEARDRLKKELTNLNLVEKVYPSDANFFLVQFQNADRIYTSLVSKGIITRNRSSVVNNCIRITVGSQEENELLLNELKGLSI